MSVSAGRVLRPVVLYPELTAVLAAAALGLSLPAPMRWLAQRDAIDVLLALLVLATGVTVDPGELRSVREWWPAALATVALGVTALPALAWAVARAAPAGPLRDGVLAAGMAPCEIASVATTAMAGGAATLAAGVLAGSTLASVVLAGPILGLESGGGSVRPGAVIVQLALVVALPLAAGLAARRTVLARRERTHAAAAVVATVAVTALVAVVAGQAHLSTRYVAVAAALVAFLVGSAALGRLVGAVTAGPPPARTAVLLTASMRDFAVAAALATAAWGPAAAAPLGLYGILVLVWGTGAAGFLRARTASHGP